MKNPFKGIFLIICILFIGLCAGIVSAANTGDTATFNVETGFDASERTQLAAILVKNSQSLYFYIEKSWWDAQVPAKQNEILSSLDVIGAEFDNVIYPTLTSVFGSEWKPGVDGDGKVTILFHPMKEGIGGYFRSVDEYLKLQNSNSNEREMLYLPVGQIDNIYKLKVFLAHEFMHLIDFNQKERINGVQEEVWLNEMRAEYAITILGYNDPYEGSNLQNRVRNFLEKPSDSLTEWQETRYDYGAINSFAHYLVDHYGINILADSLKLKKIGIESLNEILQKSGYKEDFSQIFIDWSIATAINDCSQKSAYCDVNKNLKNFRINPALNFLPLSGDSSLTVTNVTKNWAGNWQKIIGGSGNLKLEFSSLAGLNFKVPYIIFNKENNYSVNVLSLDSNQKGGIAIENFGEKYNSIVIMPLLQSKAAGFNGFEPTYPYTFTISVAKEAAPEDPVIIAQLLAQIEALKIQIAALSKPAVLPCTQIAVNLSVASADKNSVTCLQLFLKSQGADIYPAGLVTGYFGSLTKAAVARFQEKYKDEILVPAGLSRGNGYAGPLTRKKINNILMGSS